MRSKQEIRLPEECASGTVMDRSGVCCGSLCLDSTRMSFYSQMAWSHATCSALPTPAGTWPVWMEWCWSSSADQSGSLHIYEDNKEPSVTGLRDSLWSSCHQIPGPWCLQPHSSCWDANCFSLHTQTGLHGNRSRPVVALAAILQTPWLAQYSESKLPNNCLPELLFCSPGVMRHEDRPDKLTDHQPIYF